jgi:hypothetical protein
VWRLWSEIVECGDCGVWRVWSVESVVCGWRVWCVGGVKSVECVECGGRVCGVWRVERWKDISHFQWRLLSYMMVYPTPKFLPANYNKLVKCCVVTMVAYIQIPLAATPYCYLAHLTQ